MRFSSFAGSDFDTIKWSSSKWKQEWKIGKIVFFCLFDSRGEIRTNQMAEMKFKIERSDRNNNLCYGSDNKTVCYCFLFLRLFSLFLMSFFRFSSFALFCSLLVFFIVSSYDSVISQCVHCTSYRASSPVLLYLSFV